jgi:hypothetical protein
LETIELSPQGLKEDFCRLLEVIPEDGQRSRVQVPFFLVGGEHVPIVLEHARGGSWLTDDGETFMQLDLLVPNFDEGRRWDVIENTLKLQGLANEDGVLRMPVDVGSPGDSLARFIQALVEIMEVRHWTQDRVRDTFREDAQRLVVELRPDARLRYHDPAHDPEGRYPLDALVPGRRDLGLLFVANDDQCRDATISLHMFERWKRPLDSVVIFSDEEAIARKPMARLGDVAGKLLSSLSAARDRLPEWLAEREEPASTH